MAASAGSSNEPRNSFGQALESYVELLSKTDSNVKSIAEKTLELNKLAHSVMHAASPLIEIASSLEKILTVPLSVKDKNVSILEASEHYSEKPAELTALVEVLRHNEHAFKDMCNELTILSTEAKRPLT